MKKLLIFSIIFLSLVGTNCNAETTITAKGSIFKGSVFHNHLCFEIYTLKNKGYIIKTYDENHKYYNVKSGMMIPEIKDLDSKKLCKDRG